MRFYFRSFHLNYDSETEVNGIKAYAFKMDDNDYDTTIEKNIGYRYENIERIDYFPMWPTCPSNHSYNSSLPGCDSIDCTQKDNYCNDCCDGLFVYPFSKIGNIQEVIFTILPIIITQN